MLCFRDRLFPRLQQFLYFSNVHEGRHTHLVCLECDLFLLVVGVEGNRLPGNAKPVKLGIRQSVRPC